MKPAESALHAQFVLWEKKHARCGRQLPGRAVPDMRATHGELYRTAALTCSRISEVSQVLSGRRQVHNLCIPASVFLGPTEAGDRYERTYPQKSQRF